MNLSILWSLAQGFVAPIGQRSIGHKWYPPFGGVLLFILALVPSTVLSAPEGVNELEGKRAIRQERVERARVLTDGVKAPDGDRWMSDVTAVLRSSEAVVEFDLGSVKPIRAALLQGDNNDVYVVSVSEDGKNYKVLWEAGPVNEPGLRSRYTTSLEGAGRFIRLSATGGDGSYSVTELQLFSTVPSVFPPKLSEREGLDPTLAVRNRLLLFALGLVAFVYITHQGAALWWPLLAALIPLVTGYQLLQALGFAWPPAAREVAMFRGTAAAIAALVLGREYFMQKRHPADPRSVIAGLAVSAAMACASFFNLGHPQFWDHRENKPLFVHNFDMRVYYPVAKYFKELHFDGLYLASVASYSEGTGTPLDAIGHVELRDLTTHRMTRVSEVKDQVNAIHTRFSPERWQQFKTDMRYFWETMGSKDYLWSLTDHGGNATPVWLTIAYLIFGSTTANNTTLTWGGILDPLLLIGVFAAMWRCYGLKTMLLSMVVFGANDFYMFGTNWAGATLRHDWMAYLAFGACALKAKRWMLGGALLALSASIRAFPALALLGAALPAAWWLWGYWQQHHALPTLHTLREKHANLLRLALGSALCIAFFFILSSILFSPSAWAQWLHKVRLLDQGAAVNDISLRALIAGSGGDHYRLLNARMPFYIFCILLALVGTISVTRKRQLHESILLTLPLIPVFFNPSNYYLHFIFLTPLLGHELVRRKKHRGQGKPQLTPRPLASHWDMSGPWLLICIAQYWTGLDIDTERRFQCSTALAFMGFSWNYLTLLRRQNFSPSPITTPLKPSLETDGPLAPVERQALLPIDPANP